MSDKYFVSAHVWLAGLALATDCRPWPFALVAVVNFGAWLVASTWDNA